MTDTQIQNSLSQFTGTEQWYPIYWFFSKAYLTDGTKFVADECQAYWLMEAILSWQIDIDQSEVFQVWKLKKNAGGSFTLRCTDGNKNQLAIQEIPFSDFPLDEITIWAEKSDAFVLLLPSEH